jgi:hypothetical protein
VANEVNDHFIPSDLVNNQIAANRKAPKSWPAGRLTMKGDSAIRFGTSSIRATSRAAGPWIIGSNTSENFFKIGKCTSLVAKLHAFRYLLNRCSTSSSRAKSRS